MRVLLIERMGKGDWLGKIVGTGTEKAQVEACHASEDLLLSAISDPWPIFEFVLGQAQKPLADKTETLASLEKIDPERRPLFAYFMADAIAAGHDVRHFDADRLLDQVIARGRENYWRPAGATAREERLLALATMARGLPVGALASVTEKLLPAWDVDRHPVVFLAMTGRDSGENIAPLEPDIVGEHFTLACLAQTNLSNDDRARFCELAWHLNSLGMAQFMLLSHHDLKDHAMLRWVRKLPPSRGMPRFDWAKASVDLMIDLGSRDPAAARALLDDMRGVAQERGEAALWQLWATAAVNLTADLGSRNPDAARALLDDMRGVAQARGEAALWEQWARAAANLMVDLRSRDPDAARALLDDMRDVAQARGEAALWELWARAAFNLMADLGSRDPDAARALLDDMRGVAQERGEAALWKPWARAAANLMVDLRSRDPDAARALLDDMRGVAQERGEAALWEQWATAAANLMVDLGSRDPAAARALLDDMRGVAQARGEAALWKPWAGAAANLMDDLRSRDPDAARTLLDDMRGVAQARGEAALWEQWARAAANLMVDLRSRDPDRGARVAGRHARRGASAWRGRPVGAVGQGRRQSDGRP